MQQKNIDNEMKTHMDKFVVKTIATNPSTKGHKKGRGHAKLVLKSVKFSNNFRKQA